MFPTLLDSLPRVVWEPFPHVIVTNAMPAAIYARLEAEFPPLKLFIGDNPRSIPNNKRIDIASKWAEKNKIAAVWRAFIETHISQRFWARLWDVFGDAVMAEFPERNVNPDGLVQPRWEKSIKPEIKLDAALGVNTPVVIKSSVRGPHVDKPAKMIAGLFYLPLEGDTAGGDLQLYASHGPVKFEGKSQVGAGQPISPLIRIPYRRNTAVFYLNTPRSIHGVTERDVTPLPRRLVSFACCWREPMFKTLGG